MKLYYVGDKSFEIDRSVQQKSNESRIVIENKENNKISIQKSVKINPLTIRLPLRNTKKIAGK